MMISRRCFQRCLRIDLCRIRSFIASSFVIIRRSKGSGFTGNSCIFLSYGGFISLRDFCLLDHLKFILFI